jgi:hypothetical protein
MEWIDTKKIRKSRVTNGYAYVESFDVHDKETHGCACRFLVNFCGTIEFTQDIRGLRGLLAEVDLYARQYGIPLVAWDTEAAGGKLAAQKGPRYWR